MPYCDHRSCQGSARGCIQQGDLTALWMIDERREGWQQFVEPSEAVSILMLAYEKVELDPERDSNTVEFHRAGLTLRHAVEVVRGHYA